MIAKVRCICNVLWMPNHYVAAGNSVSATWALNSTTYNWTVARRERLSCHYHSRKIKPISTINYLHIAIRYMAWFRYNIVTVLYIIRKRHQKARQRGRDLGWLLFVQSLILCFAFLIVCNIMLCCVELWSVVEPIIDLLNLDTYSQTSDICRSKSQTQNLYVSLSFLMSSYI